MLRIARATQLGTRSIKTYEDNFKNATDLSLLFSLQLFGMKMFKELRRVSAYDRTWTDFYLIIAGLGLNRSLGACWRGRGRVCGGGVVSVRTQWRPPRYCALMYARATPTAAATTTQTFQRI